MSSIIIIKTNAAQGTDVLIPDMGIVIPAGGGSETFTDLGNLTDAQRSSDLRVLATDDAHGVGSSTLILNDGTSDVPQNDVDAFLVGGAPLKLNLYGTVPPTANDDNTRGYQPGSYWVDRAHDLVFVCADATTGAAEWALVSGYVDPERRLGDQLSYSATGSLGTDEVQYTRVYLVAGTVLIKLGTYLATGALAGRSLIVGVYDQAVPLDEEGNPNTKLVETPVLLSTDYGNDSFVLYSLPTPYVVAVSGFYWLAIASHLALGYPSTPSLEPGYAHQFIGTTTGVALPATAVGLTQPGGGVIDVFALEQ